ncbi:hypothetical protein RWE15_16110 [Virgibacillus halophilus]|uniref:Uncharacterized protein n=1 Tax=Tigheibacillus halophilus TaxID=361280 RepID=A0ABU5CAI3_9BACI|nr:hypothetical protein [Virgibacillus halophilus]
MSIKKRLFLSNAAMILAPIIVIIFIGFLLHIVFFNGFGNSKGGFKENWNTKDSALTRVYDALQKTASLDPDRLYEEKYLKSLTDQLHKQKAEIIIRKDDKILFHSNRQMTITKK